MILRTDIFPKCPRDTIITCLLLLLIPTGYYFQLFVVIPAYHEIWSPAYYFHFILMNFLLFNVCTNLIGTVFVDTSIKGLLVTSKSKPGWRYCTECQSYAPPRSWHCKTCKICIRQRDHHCIFTSCCIGLENQRYYLVFVSYMFISELICAYYSIYYLKDYLIDDFSTSSILKFIFPVCSMFFEFNTKQLQLVFIKLIFTGMLGNGILLHFHIGLMFRNLLTYERNSKSKCDRRKLYNTKVALGERWYLVWIAPWIVSNTPLEAIYCDHFETTKDT